MRLYFNPDCSKSRTVLARLTAAGVTPTIVDYQRDPPDRTTLVTLLDKLGGDPAELLRPAGDGPRPHTRDAVVDALIGDPARLQRPVLEDEARALIARPPADVDAWLAEGTR